MSPEEVSLKEYLELHVKKLEGEIGALREYCKLSTEDNKELTELSRRDNQELNNQHFKLNQTAIDEAKNVMTSKLDSMNEWRAQSKDREDRYVNKDVHALLEAKVRELELSKALLEGKADQKSVDNVKVMSLISMGIAIIGIILTIIKFVTS
jgi:dsDNA-specific endonuclease/ATPase MutS2